METKLVAPMNINKRPALLSVAIAALIVFSSNCFAEVLIMPSELAVFAEKKNCSQIQGFFARPGAINPPYVYGYAPGEEEDSAVFWCQRRTDGKRQYVLQFMYKKNSSDARCADQIVWPNPPGGLSLVKNSQLTSDYFAYLNDPKKSPPKGIALTGGSVLSTYDGVSAWFYCYQGNWLVRQAH